MYIGGAMDGGIGFNGSIDAVSVYKSILSSDQIYTFYNKDGTIEKKENWEHGVLKSD